MKTRTKQKIAGRLRQLPPLVVTGMCAVIYAIAPKEIDAQSTNGLTLISSAINAPAGLSFDAQQHLFVSDAEHGNILRLSLGGRPSVEAEHFEEPRDFVFDKRGNLYVADTRAGTVYRLDKNGRATVLATKLAGVCCVALDIDESVLVLHESDSGNTYTITRLTSEGKQTDLATGFVGARGMIVDRDGNLVVAAKGYSGAGSNDGATETEAGLFQVDSSGAVSRLLDLGSITPSGLTLSSQGTLLFAGTVQQSGEVFITDHGTFQALATGFLSPHGLAANRRYVFIADEAAGEVWRVSFVDSSTSSTDQGSLPIAGASAAHATSTQTATVTPNEGVDPVVAHQFQQLWGYHGTPDYSKIPVTADGVPQAPLGITCVIGRVEDDYDSPLRNVTVRLGKKATRSNSSGYWMLVDVPAGHQVYMIDGRSADNGDVHYPVALVAWELYPNQPNVLPYEAYLPVLDTAHTTKIDWNKETVHTTPLIPGLEIHIPAHTKITSVDGTPVTEITTTRVPFDDPIYPMQLTQDFGNHFTIQPGGAVCGKQIRVVYNNPANYPVGTRVQLWEYGPMLHGGWYQYGMGTVTKSARQIEPDPGVGFTTFGCGVSTRTDTIVSDNRGGHGGEPVDLATGMFRMTATDLVIPGLMPIVLQRTYRNQDNNPAYAFGINTLHSYEYRLYGSPTGAANAYVDFTLPSDTSYRFTYQTNFPQRTYICTNDYRFAGATIYQVKRATYPTHDGWNYFAVMKDGTKYDFDGLGYLRSIRDANNNTLSIDRGTSAGGSMMSVTQPSGRSISFTYNSGRITQARDSAGRTVSYVYDSSNRLVTVTNAIGGATQYTYDGSNNLTKIALPNSTVFLQNFYDSSNRVTNQIVADGGVYSLSYTITTTIVTVVSSTLQGTATPVISSANNNSGFVTNQTDSLGNTNVYIRGAHNEVLKVIDPLGRTNGFVYDATFNVIAITNAQNKVTTFTYEPKFNRLTSVVDPLGRTNNFGYDANGNLTSIVNALGKTTTIVNNQFGQPLTVTDPLTNTYTFTYNGSLDLVSVKDPLGNQVQRLIDSAGRPYALVDALMRATRINYDALNRVTSIKDPASGITSFGYDSVGNLTNVTDALSHAVNYAYDLMDRLASRTDQLGKQETYRYDLHGNVTNFVDRRGTSITLKYDALDRRTGVVYATGDSVRYVFDGVGRVTSVQDSVAGTINLGYDTLDRLAQEDNNNGTVTYGYNDVGLRTSMTAAGQSAVSYLYDPANRLTNVVQGASRNSLFYDDLGRRTKLVLPNGINVLYSYDTASRLTGIVYQASSTNSIAYSYDSTGNRVAQASLPVGLGAYNLPAAVSTSLYNNANQQLTFGGYNMLYDLVGNVTNIINGTTTNKLLWSARNQLTNMLGAVAATFAYDGLGRRVARTVSAVQEKYLYDGLDIAVTKDSVGQPLALYLRGLAIDEPWQIGQSTIGAGGGATNGLVGWWKFDEGTNTTAADSSGNGSTGTLQNGAGWGSGMASNAVSLDGVNDYVNVGDKASLEGNTAWTFAAWINPAAFNTSGDTYLFYKQNVLIWELLSSSSRQLSVNIGSGNNNSYQGVTTGSSQLNSNEWTHVAVTYTNSTVKCYVNGALADTITQTYTMGTDDKAFTISDSTRSFSGRIDDARYYNRALSDNEIVGIYGQSLTNSYFLADALGSIVALADSNKVNQTSYSYEPFGATTTTGSPSKNSYEFTGRENEGTGLYYYRARYYHPALGRFVSEDPLGFAGGQINLYGYVGNNPIRFLDPRGRLVDVAVAYGAAQSVAVLSAGEVAGEVAGGAAGLMLAALVVPDGTRGEIAASEAAHEDAFNNAIHQYESTYYPLPVPQSQPLPQPDYNQRPTCGQNQPSSIRPLRPPPPTDDPWWVWCTAVQVYGGCYYSCENGESWWQEPEDPRADDPCPDGWFTSGLPLP